MKPKYPETAKVVERRNEDEIVGIDRASKLLTRFKTLLAGLRPYSELALDYLEYLVFGDPMTKNGLLGFRVH